MLCPARKYSLIPLAAFPVPRAPRAFLHALDDRKDPWIAPKIIAHYYVRHGHSLTALIHRLVYATVREDLNFHYIQVLEAAIQQAEAWEEGPEVEHCFIGAVRNLVAACPTRRSGLQTADVALRLARGEKIYED